VLPAQNNQVINELTTLAVTNTATDANFANPLTTNTIYFTYTNRDALLADGWSYIATIANGGGTRNTEVTNPAVDGVVSYDQTAHPGMLQVPCDMGDLYDHLNSTRNSLFRSLPTNWISVRAALSFAPSAIVQQAHLALYQDDDNYVQVGTAFNGHQIVAVDQEINASQQTPDVINVSATNLFYRLDQDPSSGNINAYYSMDGTNWSLVGVTNAPLVNPQLAIWVGNPFAAFGTGVPVAGLQRVDIVTSNTAPTALTYQLINPPAGASIDTNGIITWIPSAAQGAAAYVITTVVTDNGSPPLSATNSFTVTVRAPLTVTNLLVLNKVYDGTTNATLNATNAGLSGVLNGDDVRLVTANAVAYFANSNAGTGIGVTVSGLTLAGTAAGYYTLTQPSGLTANITVLGVTITSGLSANNKPYDRTAAATISSNNVVLNGVLVGDAANVRLNTNGYTANFTSAAAGTGVGVTVSGLTLAGTATGNYTLTQPAGLTANITALGVTITSGLSANNKPYDGTTAATISSNNVVLNGVLLGDAANVRLNTNGYTANFTSAAAGTGVGVTVSGLTLAGTAAGNYTLTQPSGLSANITALGVTITSGLSANNKPYDGTTAATISSNNVVLNGVLLGDAANVRLNTNGYTANFTSAAAGTGVGVTVSGLTLAGTAAGNYTLTQPSGLSANITALGVTITSGLSANNKPYDGTTAATISSNNVVLNGVLVGDAANVRLNTNGYTANFTSAAAGTGVGVTVSGLTLAGTAAGNYTLTQPGGLTANITSKVLTITTVPVPVITSIGLTNGIVTITWDSAAGGIYEVQYIDSLNGAVWNDLLPDVTATGLTTSQTNAVGSAPQRFYRIMVLNPGITANNKVYDGTTTAMISSNNVALVGVVSGDTVGLSTNGYTANFVSANVGTGIGVTVNGLLLTGPSANNYTLTQPVGLTANITPVVLTVSAVNKSRTYGLPNSLTASYNGFVPGEGTNVLTGAPGLSTSATTNSPPGTYPITIGPGTLSAANYFIIFNGGTLTVVGLPQLSGTALNGNQFVFNMPTIAGQTYQIEYKDNLTAATWSLLGSPIVGTGNSLIITNGLSASPQRFFRLQISP
jgi:hypothetical protein